MSNPFILGINPNSDLTNLSSHVNRLLVTSYVPPTQALPLPFQQELPMQLVDVDSELNTSSVVDDSPIGGPQKSIRLEPKDLLPPYLAKRIRSPMVLPCVTSGCQSDSSMVIIGNTEPKVGYAYNPKQMTDIFQPSGPAHGSSQQEPSGPAQGASQQQQEPSDPAHGASQQQQEPSGPAHGASQQQQEPSGPAHGASQQQIEIIPTPKRLPKTIDASLVKVVHVFITNGVCYDRAGFSAPFSGQVRYVLPPTSFEPLNADVDQILTLIHRGAFPVVDISCCSWIDNHDLPERVTFFLEFVMFHNGTVRFSDFSLRVAQQFLQRVNMPLNYKLVPDLTGTFTVKFKAQDLVASGLEDLKLLSDLAPNGTVDIHTVNGTRRMVITETLPEYANCLMDFDFSSQTRYQFAQPTPTAMTSTPALILLERSTAKGRIILFSCHFAEVVNIRGVDPQRVASAIRMLQGEEEADKFLAKIEQLKQRGDEEQLERFSSQNVGLLVSSASPST